MFFRWFSLRIKGTSKILLEYATKHFFVLSLINNQLEFFPLPSTSSFLTHSQICFDTCAEVTAAEFSDIWLAGPHFREEKENTKKIEEGKKTFSLQIYFFLYPFLHTAIRVKKF